MTDARKTSTFVIHHDRCDPARWTAADVLVLANFIRHGGLGRAAALARLGVELVLSEHFVPRGGTLEPMGWTSPDTAGEGYAEALDDIDIAGGEITPLVQLYRGPEQYAVPYSTDEGREIEVFDTEEKARAFLAALQAAPDAEDAADA